MKIKSVQLREFKRFTDLQIRGIPETAKLVVLIGPNGVGKSSLFEAFNFWISPIRGVSFQKDYHWKVGSITSDAWVQLHDKIIIEFHGDSFSPREKNREGHKNFLFLFSLSSRSRF